MEQLRKCAAYLVKDADNQQPLPAELMEQAEGRFYDLFSDLSVMHRRFYDEGNNYIGVKIGEQFGLFPPETETLFHRLGYNTLAFRYGGGKTIVIPRLFGRR